jgi:hypothetical protein
MENENNEPLTGVIAKRHPTKFKLRDKRQEKQLELTLLFNNLKK